MLVVVARQKAWDREQAMAQPTNGSARDENKTNMSNRLRASIIVGDKTKWVLVTLGKKSFRLQIF